MSNLFKLFGGSMKIWWMTCKSFGFKYLHCICDHNRIVFLHTFFIFKIHQNSCKYSLRKTCNHRNVARIRLLGTKLIPSMNLLINTKECMTSLHLSGLFLGTSWKIPDDLTPWNLTNTRPWHFYPLISECYFIVHSDS